MHAHDRRLDIVIAARKCAELPSGTSGVVLAGFGWTDTRVNDSVVHQSGRIPSRFPDVRLVATATCFLDTVREEGQELSSAKIQCRIISRRISFYRDRPNTCQVHQCGTYLKVSTGCQASACAAVIGCRASAPDLLDRCCSEHLSVVAHS